MQHDITINGVESSIVCDDRMNLWQVWNSRVEWLRNTKLLDHSDKEAHSLWHTIIIRHVRLKAQKEYYVCSSAVYFQTWTNNCYSFLYLPAEFIFKCQSLCIFSVQPFALELMYIYTLWAWYHFIIASGLSAYYTCWMWIHQVKFVATIHTQWTVHLDNNEIVANVILRDDPLKSLLKTNCIMLNICYSSSNN